MIVETRYRSQLSRADKCHRYFNNVNDSSDRLTKRVIIDDSFSVSGLICNFIKIRSQNVNSLNKENIKQQVVYSSRVRSECVPF